MDKKADCHPEKKHFVKGLCGGCYAKQRYEKDKEGFRYRAQVSFYRYQYGLDYEKILMLRRKQGELCAVCGSKAKTLHLDHDHETKEVRGLVCTRCNIVLGLIEDRVRFEKAREYRQRAPIADLKVAKGSRAFEK